MAFLKDKYNTWDFIFLFWFFTNVLFNHSLIGTMGQALFMLYTFFRCVITHSFGKSKILLIYLVFVFICFLNIHLGNSVKPVESRFLLNVLIRNAIFLYCIYLYIQQLSVKKLTNIFVISCVISSISMLIYNRILTGTFVIRDAEDGLNGNMMATLNAMAICCLFALDKWKSKQNLLFILLLLLFCILTGTKKAFIVLVLSLSLYIFLSKPRKIISNVAKFVILLYVIYFALMEIPFFYDIIGNRFESLFAFAQGGETDASTNSRNYYIEYGFYYFLRAPWTGNGIHCFKEMPGVSTYSHNNYIELLFSVGIPGMIAFYLLHLYILKKAFVNLKINKSDNAVLAIALILSVLVAEYAMVTYYDRMALFYYVMILRFAMSSKDSGVSKCYIINGNKDGK